MIDRRRLTNYWREEQVWCRALIAFGPAIECPSVQSGRRDPSDGPRARGRYYSLRRAVARPAVRRWRNSQITGHDFLAIVPRFQGQNLQVNLALADALAQVATAWVASRGNAVVPLIGARHREQLAESLGAADLVLSDEDLATIEEAIPAGDRYPHRQRAALDSER